jgi:glucose/arabinose dehydrogenase
MKLLAGVIASLGVCAVSQAQVPLELVRIGGFNDFPLSIFLTQPPGETRRLYVASLTGTIRIHLDGVTVPTPFLSIPVIASGESGLLGMAFHPQFQTNGYVYVYYTGSSPAGTGTHIARYTTDPANPDIANPATLARVMFINHTAGGIHQGGWIGFGPDGYLYIASGNDGFPANSASLTTLLGKMLRIDVDHDDFPTDPNRNYAIPPANPLAGSPSNRPEIWATGLRNPWRNSFDRATGDFWISDVNDMQAGEINFQPAGHSSLRHYGYPCMEGLICRPTAPPPCICNDPAQTQPVYAVSTGGIVVGGYRYRGQAIPELFGAYIFAGFSTTLSTFRFDGGVISGLATHTTPLGNGAWSFGEDSSGEVYLCTQMNGVYRIVRACPADCDQAMREPRLTANDFVCFLNRFAAGHPYANCTGNTQPPLLTTQDFSCYLDRFAAGCS